MTSPWGLLIILISIGVVKMNITKLIFLMIIFSIPLPLGIMLYVLYRMGDD